MAAILHWPEADGPPVNTRYGDRYHAGRPLEQARAVFLAGCNLPAAWAGRARWRILETGFGLGSNFLTAWAAWRGDPARPGRLHYVAIEAHPVTRADLERHLHAVMAADPALAPLAHALLEAWWGLALGFHHLEFEAGCVTLTLAVGEVSQVLPQVTGCFDSIFLDGFAPAKNPAMWAPSVLRAVAQHSAQGARAASWCVAGAVRRALAEAGFRAERVPGLPPKRERLVATFDPPWRKLASTSEDAVHGQSIAIVGAGLAGAALADAFARRGAEVTVIGAAEAPADGASGIPAGLMAPQHSRDESLMTQLTRNGMRLTLARCAALLAQGIDFAPSGCLQRFDTPHRWAPPLAESLDWTQRATPGQILAGAWPELDPAHALWHPQAAWIKPCALVAALLDRARARRVFGRPVARIEPPSGASERWQLRDRAGEVIATADRVIVAAGPETPRLVPGLDRVRPVAGQLAWSITDQPLAKTPPANGFGHWLPDLPTAGGFFWVLGSTYEPGTTHHEDVWAGWLAATRDRPLAAQAALAEALAAGRLQRFRGIRAATTNRMPRVGSVADGPLAGLGYLTGLGSRGLSLAVLCAEALAAAWCGEPLPLPRSAARLMTLEATLNGRAPRARSGSPG